MSDIPEDILKAANALFEQMITGGDEFDPKGRDHDISLIADALLAERDRCARIATNYLGAGVIAKAIRGEA